MAKKKLSKKTAASKKPAPAKKTVTKTAPPKGPAPGSNVQAFQKFLAEKNKKLGKKKTTTARGYNAVIFDPDAPVEQAEHWLTMPFPWVELTGVKGIPYGHITTFQGRPNSGKCHPAGTKILMFSGEVKNVEDLRAGDQLMGPDSRPRTVLSTCRGREMIYEVRPNYGEPWRCNESHILSLKCNADKNTEFRKDQIYNLRLKDYLTLNGRVKWALKLYRTGVEFPEQAVPFDPYFMGLWLGDGSRKAPRISHDEPDIEAYYEEFSAEHGLNYRKVTPEGKCPFHVFTTDRGQPNPVWDVLKESNIDGQRRIPKKWLINSRENRLRLLAGLLDTDGHMKLNSFEFSCKDPGLRDDVLFLCRSLGLRATYVEKEVQLASWDEPRTYQRMMINGDCDEIPTLVKRKQSGPRKSKRSHLVTGFELVEQGVDDYYGFELDGDHLYLLGDFTVTHNTTLAMHAMVEAQMQGHQVVLIDTEYKFNFERFKNMGGDMSTLLSIEAPSLEDGFDALDDSIEFFQGKDASRPVLYVWDSLGMTPTAKQLESSARDVDVSEAARVIKKNIRREMAKIHRMNVSMIFVNHVYQNIGALFGSSTKGYGGDGPAFASVLVMEVQRIGSWIRQVDGKKTTVGIRSGIRCTKNHLSDVQGVDVEVKIGPQGIATGQEAVKPISKRQLAIVESEDDDELPDFGEEASAP